MAVHRKITSLQYTIERRARHERAVGLFQICIGKIVGKYFVGYEEDTRLYVKWNLRYLKCETINECNFRICEEHD